MRLWNPEKNIPNFKLEEGDEYKISEAFFKKTNCIEKKTLYVPDLSKDVFLSKNYDLEPFNIHEFCNRENCVDSLRCTRLRQQSFELLVYFREQTLLIETLVVEYNNEEDMQRKDELKELIRIKSGNLKLIEESRKMIIELFEKGQEAGDYLNEMVNLVKKSNK